jgi:tryptophanyl-tRNA synthetase
MALVIDMDEPIKMPNDQFDVIVKQIAQSSRSKGWVEVFEEKVPLSPAEPRVRHNLCVILRHEIAESGYENFIAKHPAMHRFVKFRPLLNPPEVMLTQTPRIPGLDGRKMSKSYGNAITLSESDADIRAKTKVMVTDPARKRRSDPGNPDVCPVYDWHKLFSPPETLKWAAEGCRTAGIGCIECKAAMADHVIKWIAPIRERRVEYEKNPKRVLELIDAGSKRARVEAVKTMARVREAVFGWEKKRKEISGGGSTTNAD